MRGTIVNYTVSGTQFETFQFLLIIDRRLGRLNSQKHTTVFMTIRPYEMPSCTCIFFFSTQRVLRLYVTLYNGFTISHLILKNEEVNLNMRFSCNKKEANGKTFQQKHLILVCTIVRSHDHLLLGGQKWFLQNAHKNSNNKKGFLDVEISVIFRY